MQFVLCPNCHKPLAATNKLRWVEWLARKPSSNPIASISISSSTVPAVSVDKLTPPVLPVLVPLSASVPVSAILSSPPMVRASSLYTFEASSASSPCNAVGNSDALPSPPRRQSLQLPASPSAGPLLRVHSLPLSVEHPVSTSSREHEQALISPGRRLPPPNVSRRSAKLSRALFSGRGPHVVAVATCSPHAADSLNLKTSDAAHTCREIPDMASFTQKSPLTVFPCCYECTALFCDETPLIDAVFSHRVCLFFPERCLIYQTIGSSLAEAVASFQTMNDAIPTTEKRLFASVYYVTPHSLQSLPCRTSDCGVLDSLLTLEIFPSFFLTGPCRCFVCQRSRSPRYKV